MIKKSAWRFSAFGSTISFKIKYYKISSIDGCFTEFWGDVISDDDFTDPEIHLNLEAKSVDSNNGRRNKKLRSKNCLNVRQFPALNFVAINGCKLSAGKIRELSGLLTVKNITSEVTLVVNYAHIKKGETGPVMIFNMFGCISRQVFKLYLNDERLDDDIHLSLNIALEKIPS